MTVTKSLDFDSIVDHVPRGKLVTDEQLMAYLTKEFKADFPEVPVPECFSGLSRRRQKVT